jgi:hypothetical protein
MIKDYLGIESLHLRLDLYLLLPPLLLSRQAVVFGPIVQDQWIVLINPVLRIHHIPLALHLPLLPSESVCHHH